MEEEGVKEKSTIGEIEAREKAKKIFGKAREKFGEAREKAREKFVKKRCRKCGWSGKTDKDVCGCGSKLEVELTLSGSILKFFIFFSSILVSLFYASKQTIDLILPILSEIFMYLVGSPMLALILAYGSIIFAAFIIALLLSKMSFWGGLMVCIIIFFIMVFGPNLMAAIINILVPGGILREQIEVTLCLLRVTSSGGDPNVCYQTGITTPEAKKTGSTQILNIEWGDESTGYHLDPMYEYEPYKTTITLRTKEKKIEGVIVEAVISNSTHNCIILEPKKCNKQNPCKLSEGEDMVVVLETPLKPKEACKENYVYLELTVEFDYSTYGRNEIIIFKSKNEKKSISESELKKRTTPETGPGPIDVIVFFRNNYYTIEESGDEKIEMFVTLKNKLDGAAYIRSGKLKSIGDSPMNKFECKFGDKSFYEDEEVNLGFSVFSGFRRFVCTSSIKNKEIEGSYVSGKFEMDVKYIYTQTKTEPYIRLQKYT